MAATPGMHAVLTLDALDVNDRICSGACNDGICGGACNACPTHCSCWCCAIGVDAVDVDVVKVESVILVHEEGNSKSSTPPEKDRH